MSGGRPARLVAPVGGFVAAVVAVLVTSAVPQAAPAAATVRAATEQVQVSVLDMTPAAPQIRLTKQPLVIRLRLQNTTGAVLDHVLVTATRADPLQTQTALDDALSPRTPATGGIPIPPAHKVSADLAPGASAEVTFATDADIIDGAAGICLCAKPGGVYPLVFSAVQEVDGVARTLGGAVTYLPSFTAKPSPVRVSWVWPILERPHRLDSETLFTDDTLTQLVGTGGRLAAALATVRAVRPATPMTLLLDPDLLDELEVMSTGLYDVGTSTTHVPGTGQAAAQQWLGTLAGLLAQRPALTVHLTPYADPDVQSMSRARLGWSTSLPPDMAQRVALALAGRPLTFDLAWPAAGRLDADALRTLADAGTTAVVLSASAVTPRPAKGVLPPGVGTLSSHGHLVGAALTTPAVQRYVAAMVTRGGAGTAQLPELLAEIAIRAAQAPTAQHVLVLTPPRYVDADPSAAAAAINETTSTTFSTPISLPDALATGRAAAGRRRLVTGAVPLLSPTIIGAAGDIAGATRTIASMLGDGPIATQVTALLALGLRRVESAGWLAAPGPGAVAADKVLSRTEVFTSGVRIVQPASGSYTLGSSNSPLPVTVENDLTYPVFLRLAVSTVNGLPGLTSRAVTTTVRQNDKRILRVPTTIARSGRIRITAELTAPDGGLLGSTELTVHSTALGTLGVVITVGSGVVLVLALLVRFTRLLRARRRDDGEPVRQPVPAGVAAGSAP